MGASVVRCVARRVTRVWRVRVAVVTTSPSQAAQPVTQTPADRTWATPRDGAGCTRRVNTRGRSRPVCRPIAAFVGGKERRQATLDNGQDAARNIKSSCR